MENGMNKKIAPLFIISLITIIITVCGKQRTLACIFGSNCVSLTKCMAVSGMLRKLNTG